jgi:hypothetical protein
MEAGEGRSATQCRDSDHGRRDRIGDLVGALHGTGARRRGPVLAVHVRDAVGQPPNANQRLDADHSYSPGRIRQALRRHDDGNARRARGRTRRRAVHARCELDSDQARARLPIGFCQRRSASVGISSAARPVRPSSGADPRSPRLASSPSCLPARATNPGQSLPGFSWEPARATSVIRLGSRPRRESRRQRVASRTSSTSSRLER